MPGGKYAGKLVFSKSNILTSNVKAFSKKPSRFNVNPHVIYVKSPCCILIKGQNLHSFIILFLFNTQPGNLGTQGRRGGWILPSPPMRCQAHRNPGHGSRFQRFVEAVGSSWAEKREMEGKVMTSKSAL